MPYTPTPNSIQKDVMKENNTIQKDVMKENNTVQKDMMKKKKGTIISAQVSSEIKSIFFKKDT